MTYSENLNNSKFYALLEANPGLKEVAIKAVFKCMKSKKRK